jgi:hypothetical protein
VLAHARPSGLVLFFVELLEILLEGLDEIDEFLKFVHKDPFGE